MIKRKQYEEGDEIRVRVKSVGKSYDGIEDDYPTSRGLVVGKEFDAVVKYVPDPEYSKQCISFGIPGTPYNYCLLTECAHLNGGDWEIVDDSREITG